MSKITLEPNSSGAGTFSIVSPDSNTNRTLTLPDEAGKLLSTGNDDPAEVFKQSNILGTVSESGGVPTGAIIESGSNSNGEFIKYADGTLICKSPELTLDLSNTSSQVFAYPAPFVSEPQTSFSWHSEVQAGSGVADRRAAANSNPNPLTDLNGFRFRFRLNNVDDTVRCNATAIGRWY